MNNDCIFGLFYIVVIKRIEIVKIRVKTELETSVQDVDVKQQNWGFLLKFLITNIKKFNKLLLNGNVFPTFGVFLTVAQMIF